MSHLDVPGSSRQPVFTSPLTHKIEAHSNAANEFVQSFQEALASDHLIELREMHKKWTEMSSCWTCFITVPCLTSETTCMYL